MTTLAAFFSDLAQVVDLGPLHLDVLTQLGSPPDLFERVELVNMELVDNGDRYTVAVEMAIDGEIVFPFPGLSDFGFVLGSSATQQATLRVEADTDLSAQFLGARVSGPLGLRIARTLLTPAALVDGQWQEDPDRETEILVQGTVGIDRGFLPSVAVPLQFDLQPSFVAGTGLVVSAQQAALTFTSSGPQFSLAEGEIHLPADLVSPESAALLPSFHFEDVRFSGQGFSGSAVAEWPLVYDDSARLFTYEVAGSVRDASLFGLSGGLRSIGLTFERNQLTGCEIAGGMVIPYFEEPVDVRIDFAADHFVVALQGVGPDGITLTKEDLLALSLRSLAVGAGSDGTAAVVISGGLEPLLMASDGLEWPRLDVTDLMIDSRGRFRIKEAWLDLKELATLDLFGFHFELSRIGLGYQEPEDKLWIDLSGSLRLIEQIPIGLGVEGFRLTWPRTLLEDLGVSGPPTLEQALAIVGRLEVQFDGVYLFYGVPDAVEFEGLIRFIKEAQKVGFAGDVALRVPATGFAAEAGLMVGMNFAEPPYPFLYVYLGVELPAGIPLGQSGLALKGALGLFGLNVAPARTPEQNWYYDWYKRGPIVGAHPTDKWRDERDALAIGLGVTITTVDGYVKGVRGLIVLAVPGPILIIEGRALILNGLLPAEPPLRALAIFDGQAQTVQFNLEAEAELVEDVLEAYGMVEAFFDFRDVTNWHLYLGQDTPPERRIRADVLKLGDAFLFKADAYLMLDMVGEHTLRSRLGAMIGFRPPIPPLGPVHVTLDAVIDGTAELTVLPEQAHGRLGLDARIELSAFGFGLTMSADAELGADGPRPLEVDAELHVRAELPLPLSQVEEFVPEFAQDAVPDIPPLEVDATLQFSWTAPEPPEISAPLVSVVAESPFSEGGGVLTIHERAAMSSPTAWRSAAETSPVVPLDVRPIIAFGPQMNDAARDPDADPVHSQFARHPDGLEKTFVVGLMRFVPSVTAVRLYAHPRDEPWPESLEGWTLVASSRDGEAASLPGVWLADGDPADPGTPPTRRLQLWTTNPLLHATDSLGPGYAQWLGGVPRGLSAAGQILEAHPTLHECRDVKTQPTCVDFEHPVPTSAEWTYFGLRFTHVGTATFETPAALVCKGALHTIRFPRTVREVVIRFSRPPALAFVQARTRVRTRRRPRTPQEFEALRRAEASPDFTACHYAVAREVSERGTEWTVTSVEGFDCLIFERLTEFALAEVCYVTVEEAARADRARAQCETNAGAAAPPALVLPGTYYRLEVDTRVSGRLRTDALPGAETPFADAIIALYESILGTLGFASGDRVDRHVAFFQTDGPPTKLSPYLKWSSPGQQATRVFRDDDLLVRFVRPNVRQMFARAPHALEIVVRSPEGAVLRGYETIWTKAGSGTELLEEELWRQHRDAIGVAAEPVPSDDVLEAQRRTAELAPSTRYEALVVGGAGGERLFHDDFAAGLRPEVWGPAVTGWAMRDGVLAHDGAADAVLVAGDGAWTDVDITIDVRPRTAKAAGLVARVGGEGRGWRVAVAPEIGEARLQSIRGLPGAPAIVNLETREYASPTNDWLRLRARVVANRVRVWAFDVLLFDGMMFELVRDWTPAARPAGTLLWFRATAIDDEHAQAVARRDLVPSTRGQIGIHAAGAADFRRVEVRDAVLHRVGFTTSTFRGFRELMEATTVTTRPVRASAPSASALSMALDTRRALARARWAFHEAAVRFGREELDRPGLEAARLTLRNAGAAHDAAFRALAEPLADGLYYAPLQTEPTVQLLEDRAGRVFGAWITSPESLDLRQDGVDASGRPVTVGRTTITLQQLRARTWRTLSSVLTHDGDSTRMLLLLRSGATWPVEGVRLTFEYHRNHGDDTAAGDHRFDRPVEKRAGSDGTETVSVKLA